MDEELEFEPEFLEELEKGYKEYEEKMEYLRKLDDDNWLFAIEE